MKSVGTPATNLAAGKGLSGKFFPDSPSVNYGFPSGIFKAIFARANAPLATK
jgi:hypothetical protein